MFVIIGKDPNDVKYGREYYIRCQGQLLTGNGLTFLRFITHTSIKVSFS